MEFKQTIGPLLKWWWLILASTLVAGIASLFAVSQQLPVYRATSSITLGQLFYDLDPSTGDFYAAQQLAESYQKLAMRQPLRQRTMDALGLTFLPEYTVEVVENSPLIEIQVLDTNRERAAAVANELANQMILTAPGNNKDQETAQRQTFIKQQLDYFESEITKTNEAIQNKRSELVGMVGARQIGDAEAEIAALENKLGTLQTNYASMLNNSQEGARNVLTLYEAAEIPTKPVNTSNLISILTSSAIGFALGIAAAYVLEYLDDTIKEPEDVQRTVNLPTIAGIAGYKARNQEGGYALISKDEPRSPIVEAYRGLRTAVLFTNVDQPIRSLLVTSAGPSEGKTTTIANLGVVMAQAGHRVLLVDADLRKPALNKIFKTTNGTGLTNLLVEMYKGGNSGVVAEQFDNYLAKVQKETAQPGLFLLTSGSIPPNPAEIVGSGRMKSLIKMLTDRYDFVLIDSPPCLVVTDSVVMSTRTDGVILVVNAGGTRKAQLRQAVERLSKVNANLSGVVLNQMSARGSSYYYADYYIDSEDGGKRKKRRKDTDATPNQRSLPSFLSRFQGKSS